MGFRLVLLIMVKYGQHLNDVPLDQRKPPRPPMSDTDNSGSGRVCHLCPVSRRTQPAILVSTETRHGAQGIRGSKLELEPTESSSSVRAVGPEFWKRFAMAGRTH